MIEPVYGDPDYTLHVGWDVDGGWDYDGDGYLDLVSTGAPDSAPSPGVDFWNGAGFDGRGFSGHFDTYLLDYVPVAFAGDVNADGYADVVVGSEEESEVYVYAGGADRPNDWTWAFSEPENWTPRVDGAGDVNADGYDDIVVGRAGSAYTLLGGADGPVSDGTTFSPGVTGIYVGDTVAGAGDVNGDGYDDVVVGAGLAAYAWVFYGSATGIVPDSWTELALDAQPNTVDGAGDVNGDGYDDVVIGMPDAAGGGEAALFLGSASGLETTPAWRQFGACGPDEYGFGAAGVGDVNADGYADVAVSRRGVYWETEVWVGSATGLPSTRSYVVPEASYDHLASAGDLDGNGADDIVIGAGVYLSDEVDADTDADADTDTACDTGDTDTDADSDTDTDADSDADADADTDSAADTDPPPDDTGAPRDPGCGSGGKGGCATAPDGAGLVLPSAALLLALSRRRAPAGR